MEAATDLAGDVIAKAKGRKDNDGTPAVITTKPLKANIADMLVLKKKADDARDRLNDKVKAVAEQSGLLSSVVRKLVNARAGDNFQEEKRKVDQLGIVFEEIGEHGGSRDGTL